VRAKRLTSAFRRHQASASIVSLPPPRARLPLCKPAKRAILGVQLRESGECRISYTRSVRPDLSGHALAGYVNSVNAPAVAPAVSTTSFDTVTAQSNRSQLCSRTNADRFSPLYLFLSEQWC
jgi:hypothetical protein